MTSIPSPSPGHGHGAVLPAAVSPVAVHAMEGCAGVVFEPWTVSPLAGLLPASAAPESHDADEGHL
jgi:hypothetical protein